MRKPDREYLMAKICALANLPASKNTEGYFTREQLVELVLCLERHESLFKKIDKLEKQLKQMGGMLDGSKEKGPTV